jgi:hypothetical protein
LVIRVEKTKLNDLPGGSIFDLFVLTTQFPFRATLRLDGHNVPRRLISPLDSVLIIKLLATSRYVDWHRWSYMAAPKNKPSCLPDLASCGARGRF